MRHPLLILAFFLFCKGLHARPGNGPTFTQNKGQWPEQVLYRALLPSGVLFVEEQGLTYVLRQGDPLGHHHHGPNTPLREHVVRVRFEGGQAPNAEAFALQPGYANYFLGNDPAAWGTRCTLSNGLLLRDIHPGITLRIDGRKGLKYDYLVAPGADPSAIRLLYDGQSGLELRDGVLVVRTTAGDMMESAPVAYQEGPAGRSPVPCRFRRQGDRITFSLPQGHDPTLPLVIDPEITFGSYSGSTADNFGFTATYDASGHLYGGGIVFDNGYPTTTGVVSDSWSGQVDIGISKWSPDGSSLVWSTYLGGSGSETPNSLVVNSNDELYVLGSTGSPDLPVTANVVGPTFLGGPSITAWEGINGGYGFLHPDGCDILLAHFSADATGLIGCTYVGGTGNDGVNNVADLAYNYGDVSRGEIALDAQERPVIATSTQSSDIFMTSNGAQITYGGGPQDAYLARFDPTFTSGQATYYGGTGADSGFGVQFASNGTIYMSGGTTSNDLLMGGTPHDASYNGGVDGYVAAFVDAGLALLHSTYVGTPEYDQCYFVQLNTADEVFVVGQTHGDFPITPGKYANPGSSQFIRKFNATLSNALWTTHIGSGNGLEDISPSAFLVSDCGQIYFSGWGGDTNHHGVADLSSTVGLPVSSDAYQPTTNGSDFYLMVLEPEAVALNYATFFGGWMSDEHVDGGTSRFDKNGNVYQAVCAGCGSLDDFPTTPSAWSQTNGSPNCNLGVFKFNLMEIISAIDIEGPNYVCLPDGTAQFVNLSIGGSGYTWDFGDNEGTSTEEEPSYTYDEPGLYTIRMILSDNDPCTFDDTTYVTLAVIDPLDAEVEDPPVICPGSSVQLHATGGHAYQWIPSTGLDDPTSPDPTATLDEDLQYRVVVTDSCGTDTVVVDVLVGSPEIDMMPDTTICIGQSVVLQAGEGQQFTWSPAVSLNDPNAAQPTASPTDTTVYHVDVITLDGCPATDSVLVIVQFGPPGPVLADTAICLGDQAHLWVDSPASFLWLEAEFAQPSAAAQTVAPTSDAYYTLSLHNACGTTLDSMLVKVHRVSATAWPDTLVCPGEAFTLHAAGGDHYAWSPATGVTPADTAHPTVIAHGPTLYQVIVTDAIGCADTARVQVDTHPMPVVFAGEDASIDYGDAITLQPWGDGTITWSTSPSLSCDSCVHPVASPFTSTTYTVQLVDANGCKATDAITIFINGSLWVPNTFTPNADGHNDGFIAIATEVKTFRMYVFDRWGLEIFRTESQDHRWNGTFNGRESPIDTYVWRVDLTELNGNRRTVYGHVNLLR
ncbi:MAG TPA: T9SS type B sorting domain-containing protein [Flavobacteriales bacterium]